MKLQRFYVAGKIPSQGVLDVVDDGLLNQLKRVLRLKIGHEVTVFSGNGQDHECFIKGFEKDKVILEIKKSYSSRFMPAREIWLCASIIKKDNFEWIVEKATELGVSHIVPILSDRSEKKSLNMERLEKIIVEASEQSGRGDIPRIHPIVKLEESIEYIRSQIKKDPRIKNQDTSKSEIPNLSSILIEDSNVQMMAFHTEGESVQDDISYKDESIAFFIGPEGGWSEREVELFHKEDVPVKSLGKQVLRAETAAVAALARIVF
jgi:16S rRNA (uracil1498-N3)-methyltransferase